MSDLEDYGLALARHGYTVWPNTTCGHGGIGGQAMTASAHYEVIDHLAGSMQRGKTIKEAADDYQKIWQSVNNGSKMTRLDEEPGRSGRAGPDGRPL